MNNITFVVLYIKYVMIEASADLKKSNTFISWKYFQDRYVYFYVCNPSHMFQCCHTSLRLLCSNFLAEISELLTYRFTSHYMHFTYPTAA